MSPIDTPTGGPEPEVPDDFDDRPAFDPGNDLPGPPKPISWNLLSAADLEADLLELNRWIDWLHRDFADARQRLRDWVATSGTRLDRDRPTRQTTWPGEAPAEPVEEVPITDRDEDFVRYVLDEVATRQAAEDAFFAGVDVTTGEVQ